MNPGEEASTSSNPTEPTLSDLLTKTRTHQTRLIERGVSASSLHTATIPIPSSITPTSTKRHSKSHPRIQSSRKPVPMGRERCLGLPSSLAVNSRSVRRFDPRFEEHCGDLREDHIERNYEFLSVIRERKRKGLEKSVRNGDEDAIRELEQMKQQDVRRNAERRRRELLSAAKKEEKEKVKRGKKPYFLKEKDVRKLESRERFEELRKKGGVKKFIEKRRKRLAAKDRKLLPQRRE